MSLHNDQSIKLWVLASDKQRIPQFWSRRFKMEKPTDTVGFIVVDYEGLFEISETCGTSIMISNKEAYMI